MRNYRIIGFEFSQTLQKQSTIFHELSKFRGTFRLSGFSGRGYFITTVTEEPFTS